MNLHNQQLDTEPMEDLRLVVVEDEPLFRDLLVGAIVSRIPGTTVVGSFATGEECLAAMPNIEADGLPTQNERVECEPGWARGHECSPRKQNEVHVKSTKATVKVIAAFVGLAFVATISVGPVSVQADTSRAGAPFVQQIGTYDYLAGPNYQGLLPIKEISESADIGLGTFNNLDGEMVVLDGTVYRVGTDGVPKKVSTKRLTPFMQVVDFDPKASMRVAPNTACSALPEIVDTLVKSTQGIVSVKLSGVFYDLELRSVPAQLVPFPSLMDAVGSQVKFPLGRINATLVGFRQGPDAKGLGAPGLHLHGLSKSKASGGHVLSCVTGPRVLLEVQQTSGASVHMPHD